MEGWQWVSLNSGSSRVKPPGDDKKLFKLTHYRKAASRIPTKSYSVLPDGHGLLTGCITVFGIWMSDGNQLPPAGETACPT